MECIVSQDRNPVPIADAIYRVCCVHNTLTPDQIDLTGLEGLTDTVKGYWWTSPYSLEILQPLVLAYDLSITEYEGKLRFAKRGSGPTHYLTEEDLGVNQSKRGGAPLMRVSESAESQQVLTTTVKYTDPGSNFAESEQIFTRPDLDFGKRVTMDLTRLCLSADEARDLAQRSTWQAVMYRQEVSFVLGPKWGHVVVGDNVSVADVLDQDWNVVLTNVTRGEDGRVECEGYRDYGLADRMPTLGTDIGGLATAGATGFYVPPTMAAVALDIGPLSLGDYSPGIYAASCAKFYGAQYRGAEWRVAYGLPYLDYSQTQIGIPEDPEYVPTGLGVMPETPMGILMQVIPDGVPDVANDLTDGFIVRMLHGELENVLNDTEFYSRNSLLYVDGEVMAFDKAELVADTLYGYDNTYLVTGRLLRGLYNTEHRIRRHIPGEPVCVIDRSTLRRHELPLTVIDSTRITYQCASAGSDFGAWGSGANITAPLNYDQEATDIGANGRPFPVAHVRAEIEASENNVLPWVPFTLYEEGEYRKIYDSTGVTYVYRCLDTHATIAVSNNGYPGSSEGDDYWVLVDTYTDYRIKWNYRSPVPVATLPTSTSETKRDLILFKVELYNSSDELVRTTADLAATEFLYTNEMMVEDGIAGSGFPEFTATVTAYTIHMASVPTSAALPGYE